MFFSRSSIRTSFVPRPRLGSSDIFNNFTSPRVARPFSSRKWSLFSLVVLLWLFFGLFGRDPWKPEETIISAIILDMIASGSSVPQFLGEPFNSHPPLYLWLSSFIAERSQFFLPIHEGARLGNALLLLLGFFLLGYTVQKQYGIRVAWLSILLTIGTVGFLVRSHQLGFGVPAFFAMTIILYGMFAVRDANQNFSGGLQGGIIISIGLLFLMLSVGLLPAIIMICSVTVYFLWQRKNWSVIVIVLALTLPLFLWVTMSDIIDYDFLYLLREKWAGNFSWYGVYIAITNMLRVSLWSLFPILPLAVLTLWFERHHTFMMIIVLLVFSCFYIFLTGDNEEDFYILIPLLAILAARSIQVVSDDIARILDSFALLVVGCVFVGGLWLLWLGLNTGFPEFLEVYIMEKFPDFTYSPSRWWEVVFAIIITVIWFILLSNFNRSNERAVVNWSCGITVVWIIFNLLFIDYIDSGKSYRGVVTEISSHVRGECLTMPDNRHWRGQLHYFGVSLGDEHCPYYLSEKAEEKRVIWYGKRGGHGTAYYLLAR